MSFIYITYHSGLKSTQLGPLPCLPPARWSISWGSQNAIYQIIEISDKVEPSSMPMIPMEKTAKG